MSIRKTSLTTITCAVNNTSLRTIADGMLGIIGRDLVRKSANIAYGEKYCPVGAHLPKQAGCSGALCFDRGYEAFKQSFIDRTEEMKEQILAAATEPCYLTLHVDTTSFSIGDDVRYIWKLFPLGKEDL
jgi:hypothetical protein